MSEATHRDLEGGSEGNNPDGDQIQSAPTQPSQPSRGQYSSFGDSSGPLFSLYSKAAEEEDNEMAERWQRDADGILIFTGLFSAAVAALLAVTVQDLRPNSQDTSAFYLGNIYGVLADPNVTRTSIPSPVAKPPPFSPPRHAVWVNSLWFLSLVMSVSCALWATSLHQWARRYIRLTQPARCSPEKRARIRAFFANGVDKMHIPWAVEGLPTLLHLSLFLFFGGLAIFLFNVDQEVFTCVVCWIGFFSMLYGLITLLPMIRHDSPYHSPLSTPAWFLYASIQYVTFTVLASITNSRGWYQTWDRCDDLMIRYRDWMLDGVDKTAGETASEQSSKIDIGILGWTISALGDDDSLEKFFEAIPGFFNSELVYDVRDQLPDDISRRLSDALGGFLGRTLSSNSVTDSVKLHRLDICKSAMNLLPVSGISTVLGNVLIYHWDHMSQTVEIGLTLAHWCTSNDKRTAAYARGIVSRVLGSVQERDDRWFELARVYGLPDRDLRDYDAHGHDSVILATLIHVTRSAFRLNSLWGVSAELTRFDIRNTLSGLQHDFCTLWNEMVQEAKNQGPHTTPVLILREIRHLYIALHQGTDAAPTAFSPSTDLLDSILFEPSSYPLCDIGGHRPDSTAPLPVPLLTQPAHSSDASTHHSSSGGSTLSRQVKELNAFVGPPSPSHLTKSSKVGDSSQAPAATPPALPVHTSPHPTDASLTSAVACALQDIPPVASLPHPLEEATQRDIVAPYVEPDISKILSTAPMPVPTPGTLAPAPASAPPALNKTLQSCDAGAATTSKPLLPASSVAIPASCPPSADPSLPNTEFLSLFSSTTTSHPTSNVTLPRLRARGLVNSGSICFANAVLQLLVHSPPFRNLFWELGGLLGQRGAGGPETGGGATPLVDATVRFFKEFVFKEEPPPTQQPPQQAAGRKPRESKEEKFKNKVVDSFEPTYMYDAMKEKAQLKTFLDGQQQDAKEFFHLYLDALDEELLALQQAESVESPLMRIFGGKFRSTVRAPNQPDTVTTEDWRSLQIDIQHDSVHTIEDALARISHLQPVQLGPSGFGEANRQTLIEVLPSVLVLHIKRFLYDVTADGIVKTRKPVLFTPELEIPLEIMAPVTGKSAEPVHYKLYGVLYHSESAGSGHYTVDVLHLNEDSGSGEAWLHIDDEAVSVVRHKDVFGGGDNERLDGRCVYVLLYCRTVPSQTW